MVSQPTRADDISAEDVRVVREIWPDDQLPRTPEFPYGKRPIHEHVAVQAETQSDAPAFTFYGRTYTWGELDELVEAFAHAMVERGYERGDVCALYLQNSIQFVVAYYGAHRAGMIAAPLNPLAKDIALEHLLTDSDASVLVTDSGSVATYESVATETTLEEVVVTQYANFADLESAPVTVHPLLTDEPSIADEYRSLTALLADSGGDGTLPDVKMDDVALLQYTGGTSGLPKGCRHTHWNVFFKSVAGVQGSLDIDDARQLAVTPVFHVAGKMSFVDRPPITGTHTVMLPRFTPEIMAQAIDAYEITSTWFTVPMAEAVLEYDGIDDYDLTSLSTHSDVSVCTAFGKTLDEETSERWHELTGTTLYTGAYGLSETHTGDTTVTGNMRTEASFVGQPTYGVEIEIRDFETNDPLPAGQEGEIVVRSPATMLGYHNEPAQTEEILEDDGFLHTGDRGHKTEEGFVYFHGRQKDVIKVSGHTVAPREIQQALEQCDLVDDTIVVGKPHERRGHVVEAHVLPTDDSVTEDAVLEWADDHLAEFKRPKSIVFTDSFPRTDIGKIDRKTYYEQIPDEYV